MGTIELKKQLSYERKIENLEATIKELKSENQQLLVKPMRYKPKFRNINEKLKDQVEMLKDTRELVQQKVDDARRNAEDIKSTVESWLARVDAIIESSELLLHNEGQQVKFNFIQRYRFIRTAVEMNENILKIRDQGNFDKVSYNNRDVIPIMHTSEFIKFNSRMSTMERVIDALVDNNVSKIGLHGMSGVGKTMLVTEISKQVLERRLFDEVVTSTVSQIPDVKRIQEELGERLGLIFKEETMKRRRLKLHKRLKMEQRILVVLDDIWKDINLVTIGIPNATDHSGCKILLISRAKHIFSTNMPRDRIFEIKVLQEEESWDLFKEIAGEVLEMPNLKPIVVQMAKECANLPIAITTVAYILRQKPPNTWESILYKLRNPLEIRIQKMNEKVYSLIKISYEELELEVKLLFLLCSIFPDDYHINVDNLYAYAMGMGFLSCVSRFVAQWRSLIKDMIDDLISSSLLLQSDQLGDNCVTMHDIVRDVAILIASENDQVCTLSYVARLNEEDEGKIMPGNYTAVYMDLYNLPKKLVLLPKVKVLILSGQSCHELEFSKDCFGEMNELKVLELQYLKISVFPLSSHFLVNLQSLLLYKCELGNIDEILQQLKNLNNLSFKESNIVEIPIVIGELAQLKILDLSFCRQLKTIPRNILSRLTKLEELDLEHSFVEWEGEDLNRQEKNASLCELKYMPRLSTLNLCIRDEKVMPPQLFPCDLVLQRFKIIIGCDWSSVCQSRTSKMLYLNGGLRSHLDDWIKTLLKKSEELRLKGTRDFLCELAVGGVPHLKHLDLYDNAEVEYFIDENKSAWKGLPNLESLCLSELDNLKNIITPGHGKVRESLFKNLKLIKVVKCNRLKNLFSSYDVNSLLNLEKIQISQCMMMEVIVSKESEKTATEIVLINLNTLILIDLPLITSFFHKLEEVGKLRPQNSEDNVSQAGELRPQKSESNVNPFFSREVSFPNLKILKFEGVNHLRILCHKFIDNNSFEKLECLEISSCDKLKNVFPRNMLLKNLKTLKIMNCCTIEGIFEFQESYAARKYNCLPQLSHLELINLPKLKYVWSEDPCELQSFVNMKELEIFQCPEFRKKHYEHEGGEMSTNILE